MVIGGTAISQRYVWEVRDDVNKNEDADGESRRARSRR